MFAGHDVQLLRVKKSIVSGHGALERLAQELGADGQGHTSVAFLVDGQRVNVDLVQQNRTTWLNVAVSFDERAGPLLHDPVIELRTETSDDREYKQQRLVREVQIGDAAFDRRVFIDNRCTDFEAKRLLAGVETRQAVQHLLSAGMEPVGISPYQVAISLRGGGVGRELDLERIVLDLLTISRVGPPAVTLKHVRGETLLLSLIAAAVVTSCLMFFAAIISHSLPFAFFTLGLVTALVTAAFAWWPMRSLVSGDSGSGKRRAWVVGLMAYVAGVTVITTLTGINAGFDDSPAKKVTGHVSAIRAKPKGGHEIIVKWSDGDESQRYFDEPVAVGTRCSEERHEGALGQPWSENLRVEPGTARW